MKRVPGPPPFPSCFFFSLLLIVSIISPGLCFAETGKTMIAADSIEYFSDTHRYVASGAVRIEEDGAQIEADHIVYHEDTSEVVATGNVRFDDQEKRIKASKAEINMNAKTGKLHDAVVFYKKENYYLSGREIEKKGDTYYHASEATFTTCDAPIPAWCFRGKQVDVMVGEMVTSRDTSFLINNVPVMYSPYLWTSLTTERQTGFLMPTVSNSSTRGYGVNFPFFWAISDNRDATAVLDHYSERGTGVGLEYRFLKPGGIRSNWWAYYIRDSKLDKDFVEVKALHLQRSPDRLGGFLNIDYVHDKEFYQEFSPYREIRIQRFIESTGELNLPLSGDSRLYLLSQYRVDLKNEQGFVPQKLPEIGFVRNYKNAGSVMLTLSADAAYLRREDGVSALRADLYPAVLHSVGKDFVVTQRAAFRDTFYAYDSNPRADDNVQRLAFEYDIAAHTRLFREYGSFTHVVEPSLRYRFVSSSENGLSVFDSTELFGKTSRIELSVLNRAVVQGWEAAAVRITQGIDTYNGDRPFLPLHLELLLRTILPLTMDLTFNVHTVRLETASADMAVNVLKTNVALGVRYNRQEDILMYTAAVDFNPFRSVNVAGKLWYDAKGEGLRDFSVVVRYVQQCWAMRLEMVERPDDFSMKVVFELAGLGPKTTKRKFTDYSPSFF